MKKILIYITICVCLILFVFIKNYTISINKISYNQYKLTCWLCKDFEKTITDICDKQFGYAITNQSLDRFNIKRSITISCKDAWGHYSR